MSKVMLLPCPFCGHEASIKETDSGSFTIGCDEYGCRGSHSVQTAASPMQYLESEALDWNRRPGLKVSVEIPEGPAKVFTNVYFARTYASAINPHAKLWWTSGSLIAGQ